MPKGANLGVNGVKIQTKYSQVGARSLREHRFLLQRILICLRIEDDRLSTYNQREPAYFTFLFLIILSCFIGLFVYLLTIFFLADSKLNDKVLENQGTDNEEKMGNEDGQKTEGILNKGTKYNGLSKVTKTVVTCLIGSGGGVGAVYLLDNNHLKNNISKAMNKVEKSHSGIVTLTSDNMVNENFDNHGKQIMDTTKADVGNSKTNSTLKTLKKREPK